MEGSLGSAEPPRVEAYIPLVRDIIGNVRQDLGTDNDLAMLVSEAVRGIRFLATVMAEPESTLFHTVVQPGDVGRGAGMDGEESVLCERQE